MASPILPQPFQASTEMFSLASRVRIHALALGARIALAESCTGGLAGASLTEVSGISKVFGGSIVAYDNNLKTTLLEVPEELMIQYGAVSAPVAKKMAEGVRLLTKSSIGLAATGIAGPGGGSDDKPAGLVYLAISEEGKMPVARQYYFSGDRAAVRQQTVNSLFGWFLELPIPVPTLL